MIDFSGICADQLRQTQLNDTALSDLIANLKLEAKNLGVDFRGTPALGGWPYAIPSDTETQFANNINQVIVKFHHWQAAGKPAPPPLS